MTDRQWPGVKYLLLVGIALTVFGVIAIVQSAVAGTAVVFVIGALLLVSGIVQILHGWNEPSWSTRLLPLVLGMITGLGGLAVLAHPLLGLSVLTLVLAMCFIVEGVWKVVASFSFRPAQGWIAVLISGLLTLLLGFLIWQQWPLSGLWAVGVLVGVDLLISGIALVALSVTIRRLVASAAEQG